MDEVQDAAKFAEIVDQLMFQTEEKARSILNVLAPGHKIKVNKNNNATVTGPKYNFEIRLNNEKSKMTKKHSKKAIDWNKAKLVVSHDFNPRPVEHLMTVDIKLKGIEIDFDTADSIVSASMLDQYHTLKEEINALIILSADPDQQNLKKHQKEDLKYNKLLLNACIMVLKHYTLYEKWPEELKNE